MGRGRLGPIGAPDRAGSQSANDFRARNGNLSRGSVERAGRGAVRTPGKDPCRSRPGIHRRGRFGDPRSFGCGCPRRGRRGDGRAFPVPLSGGAAALETGPQDGRPPGRCRGRRVYAAAGAVGVDPAAARRPARRRPGRRARIRLRAIPRFRAGPRRSPARSAPPGSSLPDRPACLPRSSPPASLRRARRSGCGAGGSWSGAG